MKNNVSRTALIYCRSARRQEEWKGSSLEAQETKCRKFCKQKGYYVQKVFNDNGVSGLSKERKGLNDVLRVINANPQKQFIVIFSDTTRLARSYSLYLNLKEKLLVSKRTIVEDVNSNLERERKMKKNEKRKVLIYCRVSSQRQVNEGTGLESQEVRCRNFCKSNNYPVEKVFQDEGVSGGLFDRPAMNELLNYIDDNPHKNYVVVFDDLKRFARDHEVHFKLKLELVKGRGVKLECLNFDFKDTPENEYVELILAGHAELERKQNRRQVIQKMKARMERGYWAFGPPVALVNERNDIHGKILVSREPYASIFKEAIEGYAFNLLNSEEEVKKFIQVKYKENNINKSISRHGVQNMLRNHLYAGLIEYPKWEIPRAKAKHKGFISEEVFNIVQDKLAGRSKPKFNKSFSPDFPLRRFVTCELCGSKLYASWNGGRSKSYPNYWCPKKGCEFRYKITNATTMHDNFNKILRLAKLEKTGLELVKMFFDEVWEAKKLELTSTSKSNAYRARDIDKKISKLADRIANASNDVVVRVYEDKIEELSSELESLPSAPKKKFNKKSFDHCWNRVEKQLENPTLLWNSPNLEDQRTVLYMYFNQGLSWEHKKGFGTANFSQSISLLQDISSEKIQDVEMGGNEPPSVNSHFY